MAHKRRRQSDDNSEHTEESSNFYISNPPDFWQLGQEFKSFRPFVKKDHSGKPYINFKDPNALRALTCCLLERDFGLKIELPPDRLCPPVPNRLNYIMWLEDLINETVTDEFIKGIDIGTGASCIYPLLGCIRNPSWSFLATEIDEKSMRYARDNVDRNGLNDRITVEYNDNPNRIFFFDNSETFSFCMCNPPFYASKEEITEGILNKEIDPSAVCTGTETEMITPGGEYAFIERIINESLIYKTRICWYTSLIGMKRTIQPLVNLLKELGITNYVVTEFNQGRTKRWGIAWSFGSKHANNVKSLDEYRPKSRFVTTLPKPADSILDCLKNILNDLDIAFEQQTTVLTGASYVNTWSRAARRQKKRQRTDGQQTQQKLPNTPLFHFRFELANSNGDDDFQSQLISSWVEGDDRDIYESFWNHVRKRIEDYCGISRGSAFSA